jgi:hypothetical protein
MVKAENLIVEGTYFAAVKMELENANKIKALITRLMDSRCYYPKEESPFLPSQFLTISYERQLPEIHAHLLDKAKKSMGIITRDGLEWKRYSRMLQCLRDDVPFIVTFCFVFQKHNDREGIKIIVRSEPGILTRMKVLNLRPKLDDFDYSTIIDTNKQFINDVMKSIAVEVLEEPETIARVVFTPTLEKLEKYGFIKVVNLFKEAQTKIQKGSTEDGLTDLREAIACFVFELVKKTGNKPTDKVSQNLTILKEQGYLDNWMHELLHKCLYDWLYRYLSAKPVHGREKINFDDAQFVYTLAENILSYLSEKIMLRR